MQLRGVKAALNKSGRFKLKSPESVVDHLVVGGGVVGLAIAQRLTELFPDKSTYLVERNARAGEETSSRNSEVIHAGLYYPQDSLKTQLCLQGRSLLYARCKSHNVPFRKTGKLVVAQPHQRKYIETLHEKAQKLVWPSFYTPDEPAAPTNLISGEEARELEPDLSNSITAALWSPETGIVDSHSFMESLETDIMGSPEGALVYSTRVVRVDPDKEGWIVQTLTGDQADPDVLLAKNLINASGLSANMILNSLLPVEDQIPMYYARGSYVTYNGPGISNISRLIYPCPENAASRKPEGDTASFAGLGTHLTLDMNGKIKFGPDVDWISPTREDEVDFWKHHLVPDESKIEMMHNAIAEYLPGVELKGLSPDYVGIRPKLAPPQAGFQDFMFKTHYPSDFRVGEGKAPMITLLGIESPGLTASLAIAQLVVDRMLFGEK